MNRKCKILIVSPRAAFATRLAVWLGQVLDQVVVASTFKAAIDYLKHRPALVITEMKLGAYNGLHVAFRGTAEGIPSIVVGPSGLFFEREAKQLGAIYVPAARLKAGELGSIVRTMVPTMSAWPARRSPFTRAKLRSELPRKTAANAMSPQSPI